VAASGGRRRSAAAVAHVDKPAAIDARFRNMIVDLAYDATKTSVLNDAVRPAAALAVVRFASVKAAEARVGVLAWRGVGALLRHAHTAVRAPLLHALDAAGAARHPIVPLRYVALLALAGADSDKELRELARAATVRAVQMRAGVLRHPAVPASAKPAILPECALPYVLHLLACTRAARAEVESVLAGGGDSALGSSIACIEVACCFVSVFVGDSFASCRCSL
jgi:hypothetical protein